MGSSEYGFYFSLLSFSLLFNILLDIGITNFNNRSLSQNPSLIKDYFSNIVVVKLLLALVYGIISFAVALAMGYETRQLNLLVVLIFNQFLSSFLLYLRSNISGLQFYTTDSLLSVLDRGIMIVLCSLMIWGHILHQPLKIEWFVYVQSISYLAAMLIIGTVLYTKTKKLTFVVDWKKIIHIVRQIAPYAILGLLMSIYTRTDSVLIERLLPDGKTQAGIYAQSFRILDAFSNFSLLFASLLLPMFSRLLVTKEDFVPLLKTSFSLLLLMCLALSLPCFAFSKPIIYALYHEGSDYSASVFSILILSFIPISVNYIFGTLLTANGSLKLLNYAAAVAVCLNIILNLVLIGHYKVLGAAIANLVTQSMIAIAQIALCFTLWKYKLTKKTILKYSLFVITSATVTYSCLIMAGPWVMRFLSAILVIGLLSLVTGVLSFKQIFKAIKL